LHYTQFAVVLNGTYGLRNQFRYKFFFCAEFRLIIISGGLKILIEIVNTVKIFAENLLKAVQRRARTAKVLPVMGSRRKRLTIQRRNRRARARTLSALRYR